MKYLETLIGEKFWYILGMICVMIIYAYLSNMDYQTELVAGHVDDTTVIRGTWETTKDHYILHTASGREIIMDEYDPPEYSKGTRVIAVFDKHGLVHIEGK